MCPDGGFLASTAATREQVVGATIKRWWKGKHPYGFVCLMTMRGKNTPVLTPEDDILEYTAHSVK